MAKESMIQRNLKRRKMNKQMEAKRKALKKKIYDKSTDPQERFLLAQKLAKLPRNSSKTRINEICLMTGRPRGTKRRFSLCRNVIRELASKGQLPGVKKSSW